MQRSSVVFIPRLPARAAGRWQVSTRHPALGSASRLLGSRGSVPQTAAAAFSSTRSQHISPGRRSVLSELRLAPLRSSLPYASPLYTTQTRTVLKDFYESFRKNLKKNIEQEPEFGGDLKRLQQTSDSVKEVAKTTKDTGSSFGSKMAEAVKSRVSAGADAASKMAKEKTDRLKEATAPLYEEAVEEAKKAVDMEKIKETQEAVNKVLEETRRRASDAAEKTSDAARKTAAATSKIIDPVTKTVSDSKIVQDYKIVRDASNTKSGFNPTPEMARPKTQRAYSTELVTSTQSQWHSWKEKLNTQWNELGDSNSRLSYLVEAVDSLSERWRKISSSPIGILVANLKKEYPDFDLEAFKEWSTKELMPRVLTSPKYDDYVAMHSGDLVKQMYKTKQLPLPWKLVNVSSSDIFPAQNASSSPTDYKFFFSVRGQVAEIDKETKAEVLCNIVMLLAVRLNEEKVWVLSEFTEVEKTEALF